jgi:hypothetical protein
MSGSYTADQFYQNEIARLSAKQNQATNLSVSQKRLSLLNDSYRKRYAKYVQILMVLVLAYIAYLGMSLLQKAVPKIQSMVFDIFLIALIFLVAFYLYSSFTSLSSRNNTNYDELNIQSIHDGSGVDTSSLLAAGKLAPNTLVSDVCVGQECCPTGYTWDQTTNKCVVSAGSGSSSSSAAAGSGSAAATVSTFTTLEYAPLNNSETKFDDPSLKRSSEGSHVQITFAETVLNFSKI